MRAKLFKMGLAAAALVFALPGCGGKTDSGLMAGVGTGGLPGAGGAPGGGGAPGLGGTPGGGGAPGLGGTPTEADLYAEEQTVYAALLGQRYPASLYVLQTETGFDNLNGTVDEQLTKMLTNYAALSGETTASFAARNATAYPMATDLNIGAPYVLISDEEVFQLGTSGADFWVLLPEFSARYPGASCYTQLSRVGFNGSLDQALVYIGHVCGPRAGKGIFHVLHKSAAGWIATYDSVNWIS
jgi:hypothetical protein